MLEYSHDHGLESPLDLQGDYPLQTKTTTELLLHCEALQMLFVGEDPLLVPLRPTDKGKLRFYVGDALVLTLKQVARQHKVFIHCFHI